MNNMKKPKIRFKGFTDDWEQRKLGELGKTRSGIGFPDAEQGGKEGVPFYKVSDMNNVGNEHEMVAANNHVTREQIARKGWKPIDEVPAIFFAKVGAAVLLNRKRLCRFPFLLDNNTMAYSIDGSALDADFAITLFDTIDLTSLVQVGALPSYNSGDVENIDAVIPEMSEQRKIGAYFKRIDSLITLHQRKYEKLQIIKKSMLENCFPKNGEKVPKIRFSGFTGDWEQCKLSEMVGMTYGGGTPSTANDTFWYGDIPWIPSSNVVEDELFNVDIKKHISRDGLNHSAAQLVPENSVAVVTHVGVGKLVFMPYSYTTSQDFISLGDMKCEPRFLCYALYKRLQEDLHIVQGSAIKGITKEDLMNKLISVPQITEQTKIANTLQGLDHLITLHQSELEKLQKIKKSLLERMFV